MAAFQRAWQRGGGPTRGPADGFDWEVAGGAAAGGASRAWRCRLDARTGAACAPSEQDAPRGASWRRIGAGGSSSHEPPLMRVALVRVRRRRLPVRRGATTTCSWTAGRCRCCSRRCCGSTRRTRGGGGPRCRPSRPYRDYIAWLAGAGPGGGGGVLARDAGGLHRADAAGRAIGPRSPAAWPGRGGVREAAAAAGGGDGRVSQGCARSASS